MTRRLLNGNVLGGAAVVLFGAAYLAVGSQYRMGSMRSMGPGYFPFLIGISTVVIGCILLLRGLFQDSDRLDFSVRPVVAISGSIAVFAGLVTKLGLAPAIAAVVLLSALAEPNSKLIRSAFLAVFLILLSWAVFVLALGMPFRMLHTP